MTKKNNFIMLSDWRVFFDSLGDKEAGELIKKLFAFAAGEKVTFSGELRAVGTFITSQIEESMNKYDEMCERNRENIKKRYKKGIQPNTVVESGIQPNTVEYECIPNKNNNKNNNNNKNKNKNNNKNRASFVEPNTGNPFIDALIDLEDVGE